MEDKVYVCTVCGYEEAGEMGEDYVCPICGAPKAFFEEKK